MTIVTNPGDFQWKPLREIEVSSDYPVIEKTTGTGVHRSYLMSTNIIKEWTLQFKTSYATYVSIINFLNSKKNGHQPFTWRSHLDNVLYTVKLVDGIKIKTQSDNTSAQRAVNMEFDLKFRTVF